MLLLVDGEEVGADALGELGRVGAACREPGLDVESERAVPRLCVREVAGVYEVGENPRGELEDLLEQRVPRSTGSVGSARGDHCKLLGKESEEGGKDVGSF